MKKSSPAQCRGLIHHTLIHHTLIAIRERNMTVKNTFCLMSATITSAMNMSMGRADTNVARGKPNHAQIGANVAGVYRDVDF